MSRLDALFELKNLVEAAILCEVASFEEAEAYREDGVCTTSDWLTYRMALLDSTSREIVATAKAFQELPHIAEAFLQGRISRDQLTLLCRFVPQEEDSFWATEAQRQSAAQTQESARFVRRVRREDAAAAHDRRYLPSAQSRTGLGISA